MNTNKENAGSGSQVASLFLRSLGLVFAIAFISIAVQADELISSRGLLPIKPFLKQLNSTTSDSAFWVFPSIFLFRADDIWINHVAWVGVLFSLMAAGGIRPRLLLGLSTVLYLSYAVACRDFLYFQWDNLLIECGFLSIFLPKKRRADWIHFLFRVLLFKLYMESGLAKWQSYLHDWHDGSAMTFYYQTAPIPTRIAWYFHHLPQWWHHFESWLTLGLELVVPVFIFCGRRLRAVAFFTFTGFQILNIGTANYGFFSYQALILHLFLLEERDLRFLPKLIVPPPSTDTETVTHFRWDKVIFVSIFTTIYLGISVGEGISRFANFSPSSQNNEVASLRKEMNTMLEPIRPFYRPFRIINTYHLFGHITRKRIEPQFEVRKGGQWHELHMKYKPGPLDRAPPFVAPHQPRVDFRLWFHGLGRKRGHPQYVRALVRGLCEDPTKLQGLFESPLETEHEAVRIRYWDYRYTTPEQRAENGNWWFRTEVDRPITSWCN